MLNIDIAYAVGRKICWRFDEQKVEYYTKVAAQIL